VSVSFLFFLMTAASPSSDLVLLKAIDARVAQIGYRLATRNVPLCANAKPLSGFEIHDLAQYAPFYRAEAARIFSLDGRPSVLTTVKNSPADRAGLRGGDRIVAIGGSAIAPSPAPRGKASYKSVADAEAALAAALSSGGLTLQIERGGSTRTVSFVGDRGCPSRVQVVGGSKLNAHADGAYVEISTGMVGFTNSDDELAVVIAHEMAHNVLGHKQKLDADHVSRGLFGGFGRNGARIRATENEADRVGLYLMARAGYDITVAPAFWSRYGRKTGAGLLSDRTHPGTRERVTLSQAVIAEITAKQARGDLLTPTQ
jgi:beta-barrel assembly-enhancing protease